jgi:hypothetical protein
MSTSILGLPPATFVDHLAGGVPVVGGKDESTTSTLEDNTHLGQGEKENL